jgi:hypothetical protein
MKYLSLFIIGFVLLACDGLVYEKEFIDKGSFEITFPSDNVLADSFTETTITISLPKDSKKEVRKITVTTTDGKFAGEDKKSIVLETDIEGKAICKLISPSKEGKSLITATTNELNLSVNKEIGFKPAYPENIYLAFTAKTDSTAIVTLKSNREKGKVSEDLKVVFEISPQSDKVLMEQIAKTDANGGATTNLVFPKTYKGTIKATIGTISSKEYAIK